MKKLLAILLTVTLALTLAAPAAGFAEQKQLKIVTTIFPIYDWARQIIGGRDAEITMLLDSGVDLHNFQPTAQDIVKVTLCDLFIFVGGESDEWTEDVLNVAQNDTMAVINLLDALGDDVKEEEIVEGMEAEEEEDEEEEAEADEHVWLSLRNAQKLVRAIADALCEIDPESAEMYRANAESYLAKLQALDERYTEMVSAAAYKTVLFGDRFPFRYLADDYGLTYYAAFAGCSAETEASFQTILFLAQKVDELNLPAVLTIENPKTRIAETVVNATQARNQKILAMNSLQGVTAQEVKDGVTYLSVMENNLTVLRDALN